MKIEIELSDLESLRDQLRKKEQLVLELQEKIKGLSEDQLKKEVVRLSYRLFDNYMGCVFKQLGFGEWQENSVIIRENLEHWIGKDWWNQSDRIKIDIGATVTTKFKEAFLSIGIKPKE